MNKQPQLGDSPIFVAFGVHHTKEYFCSSQNNLYIRKIQEEDKK